MKKYLLIFALVLLDFNLKAQVAISYDENYIPDPNSVLDLSSIPDKGFLGPKVSLTSRYDNLTIRRPNIGLVVYNTATVENIDPVSGNKVTSIIPGYYSWDGSKWMSFESKESTKIVNNINISAAALGYLPQGTYQYAPVNFEKDGINAKQTKCTYAAGTQQVKTMLYCAYDLTSTETGEMAGVNWNQAFSLAKEIGGHLPVINSSAEIKALELNFFYKDTRSLSRYHNAWIGLKSIAAPGEKPQFQWVTGEKSQVDWGTGKYIFNFENNMPTTEGCGFYKYDKLNHLTPNNSDPVERKWNVTSCDTTSISESGPDGPINFLMSYLLVEFIYE